MSTVRRNHEHSAPLSPRHAGPQRRTAAERADRAFTFHRGRSDAPTRHDATPGGRRSRGCAACARGPTAPRRARPDLIAAYGSPFAADPRRSVRLRMYFKVHPRRWMAARSTGRSTTKQPAVGERGWGTGHSHCESRDETRGTTRAKGPDLEPFWVLLQPPTEITDGLAVAQLAGASSGDQQSSRPSAVGMGRAVWIFGGG